MQGGQEKIHKGWVMVRLEESIAECSRHCLLLSRRASHHTRASHQVGEGVHQGLHRGAGGDAVGHQELLLEPQHV